MLKFGMFKRVKHNTFDFKPRYYDPEKEALKERLERYKTIDGEAASVDQVKDRIKSGLRSKSSYHTDMGYRRKQVRNSNFRLLSIITVLTVASYLMLQSSKLDGLFEAFLK